MTLLQICKDAADEIGIERPTSVFGSTNPTAQKLYRYATRVCKELVQRGDWQVLRVARAFTALGQETQTDLFPADYDHMVKETFWDQTNKRLISGPIDEVRYQSLVSLQTQAESRWWLRRGNDGFIYPLMSGGESLSFVYISNKFCANSGGTAQSAFAADTDTTRIPEELVTLGVIYYYLRNDGQPWDKAYDDFEQAFSKYLTNDQPSNQIMAAADVFAGPRNYTGTPGVSSTGFDII
jgi:hypothetical protein